MSDTITYRKAVPEDIESVRALVERVFLEFVAPDFSKEGVDEFLKYLDAPRMQVRFDEHHFMFVAETGGEIAGMIEIRNCDHISLLYVDKEHQGKGIGRRLFELSVEECLKQNPQAGELTVNASLYAQDIYRKLGFAGPGLETKKNGMRFVPLTLNLK